MGVRREAELYPLKRTNRERSLILKNDKGISFNSKSKSHLAFILTVCPPPIQDFERAFNIYSELERKAFQETNPSEYVGFYHYFGLNAEKDLTKAKEHLILASQLGSAQARATLGNIYLSGGDKVEKDYQKAYELLNKSAKQGEFYAMQLIVISHAFNLPAFKDDKNIEKWINILISAGYDSFSYLKNMKYESSSDGLTQLNERAAQDPKVATICGIIYLYGIEVNQSDTKGFQYLDSAIKMDSDDARALKANYIFDNPLNLKLYDEALKLVEEGWRNKNKAAGIQLAVKKTGGIACEQDWAKCYEILSNMDLENQGYARFIIGQCYLYGMGTKRDVKKGLSELLSSAQEGNTNSALFIYDNYNTFDAEDRIGS